MKKSFDRELVSIVMPAWKAEDCIAESIESVMEQDYPHWELLIVDDCSPDGTAALVERFVVKDSRVKLLKQSVNQGPAEARNRAIRMAKGRWIAFLDSDDIWLKEKLSRQIAFHQASDAVVTFTQFRRFINATEPGVLREVPERLTYNQLLGNTAIATSTVLVDRSISGYFEMKPIYYDDFGCWLDLLREGQIACGMREDLMRYRVLPGSVSRNKFKSACEVWKIYRNIEGLGFLDSSYYFLLYAVRGWLKYRSL